ncbi:MAG: hypothetical protein OXI73_01865, partial [Rhodospirillales bacterium]|nr:hypothetical protein [Rhodospirillales bacterium]
MKAARIVISAVVAVLAVFALAVIWRHEWLGPADRCLADVMGWILSAIVTIPAGLVLATMLCPARRKTEARSGDATDYRADYSKIPNPYPKSYKPNSITGVRYACPLHVMRLA